MANKPLLSRLDWLPVLGCLALAGVLFVTQFTKGVGERIVVQTPQGEQILTLSEDAQRVFVGHDGLSVTVVVQDEKVRVVSADCHDQVCVHTGAIGAEGQTIACLPAGIVLTVEGVADDDAPDAVVR